MRDFDFGILQWEMSTHDSGMDRLRIFTLAGGVDHVTRHA